MAAVSSTPGLDARVLVGQVSGLDDVQLVVGEHQIVDEQHKLQIEQLTLRRLNGEPVARILGHKEFYGLRFELNEATLVPRPETEMLVERSLELLAGVNQPRLLELGVGSGCIGISILAHLQDGQGFGVDISVKAIEGAQVNAKAHGIGERMQWGVGSWFEPVGREEKFDLIVSNPPYIASKIILELDRDVREYDPGLALDGGADGLEAYRVIIGGALDFLKENGTLLLEIGFDQEKEVTAICQEAGLRHVKSYTDLAGQSRMVEAGIVP